MTFLHEFQHDVIRVALALTLTALLVAAAEPGADDRYLAPFVFIGSGSGVVVSTSGEILTNYHVAGEICSPALPALTVRLAGIGEWPATLIAADPLGDLALIQLNPGFPEVTATTIAEQMPLPGTPVIAVGNPFGLGNLDDRASVSRGVLGTGRVVRGSYSDCVQHDAPVNPGNSGGPLFDEHGRLLGINGAIRSRSGFRINSGIGLAIAAPQLSLLLPALRAARVDHGGWLWRSAAPTALRLRTVLAGVVVEAGPPALLADDVLVAIDDRACPSVATATGLFATRPWHAGLTVPVLVRRAGSEVLVEVPVERAALPGRAWHGLTLAERAGQVVIDGAEVAGPAALAGAVVGETVLTINGVVIENRLAALRATATLGVGDRLTLDLRRAEPPFREHQVVCFLAPEPDGE